MGRKIKNFANMQHDFKKYIRNEPSGEVKMRLLGLYHVQEGKSCRTTAQMLKVNEKSVQNWVKRFAVGGLEGLQHQPGQGCKKRFNKQDLPQIKAGILALQKTKQGGRVRGEDIKQYLLDQWNIQYKRSAVYALLSQLSIVWISARSKHSASKQETQDAFKKTSSIWSKKVLKKLI